MPKPGLFPPMRRFGANFFSHGLNTSPIRGLSNARSLEPGYAEVRASRPALAQRKPMSQAKSTTQVDDVVQRYVPTDVTMLGFALAIKPNMPMKQIAQCLEASSPNPATPTDLFDLSTSLELTLLNALTLPPRLKAQLELVVVSLENAPVLIKDAHLNLVLAQSLNLQEVPWMARSLKFVGSEVLLAPPRGGKTGEREFRILEAHALAQNTVEVDKDNKSLKVLKLHDSLALNLPQYSPGKPNRVRVPDEDLMRKLTAAQSSNNTPQHEPTQSFSMPAGC